MDQFQLIDWSQKTVHDVLELFRDKIVRDVMKPDSYLVGIVPAVNCWAFGVIKEDQTTGVTPLLFTLLVTPIIDDKGKK